ncbi:MYXO-CTERM sorting domain-containing protein [Nannocystis exedens]|uniref:MYXO-CTERM sorting domain-containing protein n=1 Tax=Nannocystis exedens TaxID=54 RepID=UPI000BBA067C|nr:MYXO-CTERM sorting domain-containing protein [Nannocystis exedens]
MLATFSFAGTARAELPAPADFSVSYYVTDESGEFVRPMVERDFYSSLNRARCECGQQVGIQVQAKDGAELDLAAKIQAFVGTECAEAESSIVGQFLRCGALADALAATFAQGVTGAFHPAFLASGVDPSSPTRDVAGAETILGNACDGLFEGETSLWMCDPGANNTAGCQPEEFFYGPDSALSQLSAIPTLKFDFQPPLLDVENLTVEPGDGGVELHWDLPASGDIQGFRVLCEEAATGASPGLDFPTPELAEVPTSNHYFTAGNLCGDRPFSTVKAAPADVTDPGKCGNGVVEAGEACDDGDDNGPAGLCDESCGLRVSPSLHALDWDHVCSDHLPFSSKGAAIHGLENGKTYNFVLVSYDVFGNPRVHGRVVAATPDESFPGVGGGLEGEGCACAAGDSGGPGVLSLSLVALLGLARRRR